MEGVFSAVSNLWKKGFSKKEISRRLNISEHKVRKILVTIGITGKTLSAVNSMLPYTKCPYNQLHPTGNALRIRKHRTKRKEESEQ